jgi:hypothetical protein
MSGDDRMKSIGGCLGQELRVPAHHVQEDGGLFRIWLNWMVKMPKLSGDIFADNGTGKMMLMQILVDNFFDSTFSCYKRMYYPIWRFPLLASDWFGHTNV